VEGNLLKGSIRTHWTRLPLFTPTMAVRKGLSGVSLIFAYVASALERVLASQNYILIEQLWYRAVL